MLKSELMDLLHDLDLDDSAEVYFDDGTHTKKVRHVYVDADGDVILSNREGTK